MGEVLDCGAAAVGFRPGYLVWYAGDINRPGAYAELQAVDHRAMGVLHVDYIASLTASCEHLASAAQAIKPFGSYCLIDDPKSLNISVFKRMTSEVEHLQAVLSNHELALAREDAAGVASNYHPKAILIANGKTFIGRAAIQGFYERLLVQLPQASWVTDRACFAEDLACVEWSCRAGSSRVSLGVDTFVVGPAGIVRQTAWFSLISAG